MRERRAAGPYHLLTDSKTLVTFTTRGERVVPTLMCQFRGFFEGSDTDLKKIRLSGFN